MGLRVGFVSTRDPREPDALSGMPYAMMNAIAAQGHDVVALGGMATPRRHLLRKLKRHIPRSAKAWARAALKNTRDTPHLAALRFLRRQRQHRAVATRIESRIRVERPDVLFGCCISTLMGDLDVEVPMVYFSDATAQMINTSYPVYRARGPRYKEMCHRIETAALGRISAGAFASDWARRSAVRDHDLPADRAFTVPMGAHVVPEDGQDGLQTIDPPDRSSPLNLCIVAADPERKRVDFAVEVTEDLAARGWDALLTHVGPPTPRSHASPRVVSVGRLHLSSLADRRRYQHILLGTHFMLLPSIAEAFGIAPCEAAHFARPSIVTGVGGLPEVVQHGRTGLVMPPAATACDFADSIETIADDPTGYIRMCRSAHRRARDRLCWSRWAERISELLERAASSPA